MSKVRLGDVAEERKETCKQNADGYPIVGLEHLIPEDINLSEWSEGVENTFSKIFREGDVLFGRRRAYLKKAAVAPFDGICSGDITVIKPISGKIRPELLPFVIQNDNFFDFAVGKSAGSLSPRVKWENLKNYEFELPDLEKQKELAKVLWAMDATKRSYQKMLQITEELVKAQFIEMFIGDSKEALLSDYVVFQEGPGVRSVDFAGKGVILLTGSNINKNTISFGYSSDRHISNELAEGKYSHFMCNKGDILVVTSAIDPKRFDEKVVVVDEDNKYCLNTGIIRFKPDEKYMTRRYFIEFLKSNYFKQQVMKDMVGIAQMHFGPSHLNKMNVLIPNSIDKQVLFSDLVQQSEESKHDLEQALAELSVTYKKIISENLG